MMPVTLSRLLPRPSLARCRSLLLWLAIALSCYLLALITWQLLPVQEASPGLTLSAVKPTATLGNNDLAALSALASLAPFGRQDAAASPQAIDGFSAPETRLPLKLTGVVASAENRYAIAIIEHNRRQASYGVGETIAGARIQAIFSDRVVIEYQGTIGTLRYDDASPSSTTSSGVSSTLKKQLQAQPQQILDYLSVAPAYQDQELQGYRINPGKNPAVFQQLGFKADDLAIAIDGADLRDPQQAQQIMQQLPQLTELTVTVQRDGQLHNIDVTLAEDAP